MKAFLLSILFFAAVVHANSDEIEEEFEKADKICSEEFGIADESDSSSVTSTEDACFQACLAMKVGIIENKKFNMEKYEEVLRAYEKPEDVEELIRVHEHCIAKIPDSEDECQLISLLDKCVENLVDSSQDASM